MFTRISSAGLLLLAGCSSDPGGAQPVAESDTIDCALAGAGSFSRDCWLERDGEVLVVHHPDGGFRRLEWFETRGGHVLDTADGVERARTEARGDRWEVVVGNDRYLVPIPTADDDR